MGTLRVNAAGPRRKKHRGHSILGFVAVLALAMSMQTGARAVATRGGIAMKNARVVSFRVVSQATSIEVSAGEAGEINFSVERTAGFKDRIALSVSGLPKGATGSLTPRSFTASVSTGRFGFRVPAKFKPTRFRLTISASANEAVSRASVDVTVTTPTSVASTSTGAPTTTTVSSSAPTTSTLPTPAPTAPSSDYSIAAQAKPLQLPLPGSVTTAITVNRIGGYNAPIPITIANLPAGMIARVDEIPAGSTTGTIRLDATSALQPGTYELTVKSGNRNVTLVVEAGVIGLKAIPEQVGITPGLSDPVVFLSIDGRQWTNPIRWSVDGIPPNIEWTVFPNDTNANTVLVTFRSTRVGPATYAITYRGESNGSTFVFPSSLTISPTAAQLPINVTALRLTPSQVVLQPGMSATIVVSGAPGSSAKLPYVTLAGLPAGVASSVSVAGAATPTGVPVEITLTAALNAASATSIIFVSASSDGRIATTRFPLAVLAP